ncbi:MAG: YfgM family protein [Pseudomonadota bacterium]
MDVYRTEEEQIAAIKSWWKDNGLMIVGAVLLAVAVFAGWKWYQHHERTKSLAAAGLYQTMMQSWQEVLAGGSTAVDAEARMAKAGEELATGYGDTPYARFAALVLAARAVEKDDLTGAEQKLRAVIAGDDGDAVATIATHRLAQVLSAQGKHDDALALLVSEVAPEFAAAREETRGDILLAQGKRAEARAAWQKALDTAAPRDPARMLLEMKLAYVAGE